MLQAGPALKVTVHLNQDTSSARGFLHEDVLDLLQKQGVAGATAVRAYAGFGAHHRLHREDMGDEAGQHLPIIIYFVEEAKKVHSLLPALMAIVTDGLIEAHPTEVFKNTNTAEKVLA